MLYRLAVPLLLLLWALPLALHAQSPTALSALSGEFDDPSTLSEWTRLAEVEGWTDKLKTLDVDETAEGALYLEPYPSVWFYDYTAPLLFQEVEGNFIVTTRINVSGAPSSPTRPPPTSRSAPYTGTTTGSRTRR